MDGRHEEPADEPTRSVAGAGREDESREDPVVPADGAERADGDAAGANGVQGRDRTDLWLGLLRRLTDEYPDWSTWKNVDSALAGTGDVDSLAPPRDWDRIEATFTEWAAERGYGPVISCPHILMGPHLVTFEPGAEYIVQLDVKERATFRGSTLIDVPMLRSMSVMDERGFRRVRKGVDGVVRLCSNGIRPGGDVDREALRIKQVPELLAADPEGVQAMAEHFGPARAALLDGARAVVEGGWDKGAMRKVELWALARSTLEPSTVARRVWFARRWKHRCPVVRLVRERKRRVPEDMETWLREVREHHRVIDTHRRGA